MFSYIKMDLYKLFKSKSFYVCMLVFLILIGTVIAETRDIEKDVIAGEDYSDYLEDTFYTSGIGPNPYVAMKYGISLHTMINMTYGGNIMIFMALIALVLFICNDFSGGYIKNTIVIPRFKWYTNISRLEIAFVILMVQNILAIIAYMWAIKFYFETGVVGELKGLIQYLAVEALLFLAIAALFIFLCDLTHSKALGISVGVFLSCQLLGILIVVFLAEVFGADAEEVLRFIISNVQSELMVGMSGSTLKESLILGFAAMLVYLTLANIVVCKKDY